MNWFIGLLAILIGVFMVLKTEWIYAFIGPVEWAEAHLGAEGGTRLFIKLLGILLILGVFLAATGLLGTMLRAFFGPLFGPRGAQDI